MPGPKLYTSYKDSPAIATPSRSVVSNGTLLCTPLQPIREPLEILRAEGFLEDRSTH